MSDILQKIAAYKHDEVDALRPHAADIKARAADAPAPRGFARALAEARGPALIAEVKKASPSKGLIRDNFDPANIARAYQAGGATCLSVLTDGPSFQGSADGFAEVRKAVKLPLLRKDFMVDPLQIYESRAMGADCILIIMAMIEDGLAKDLFNMAKDLGMDSLIETHDMDELDRALVLGGNLIGINNRNLKTFETTLTTFKTLAPRIPIEKFLVAESGIFTPGHILDLTAHGARAFLVGESLMRQDNVELATRRLLGLSATPLDTKAEHT
ncbi:indole-3-glycerol phosphate synthase TrpC [Robiginitomaculum antarcticum]|uniref:indole-3-glycerol phosphate synthase TrpC n=1 Tax=Robiginitomaculum antarcticum TaxID=437507 RepID=UPI000372BCCC|nr:indole-3-glycerol phosphate synthase TrpC [Robiginitomaculum antarcticum]